MHLFLEDSFNITRHAQLKNNKRNGERFLSHFSFKYTTQCSLFFRKYLK